METQDRQYRFSWPPKEFWDALIQVRNYLSADPAFRCFCLQYLTHKDPLAEAFWIVDKWIDAQLLREHECQDAKG